MTALHKQLLHAFSQYEDSVAIESRGGDVLTYRQLGCNVRYLMDQVSGLSHGNPIVLGILSTRCAEAYIGVLAAYFSCVRFVPLNPNLPVSRLTQIVSAGNIDIVMYDSGNADVAAELNVQTLQIKFDEKCNEPLASYQLEEFEHYDDAIAYQMFTSGSTGDPKGVPIPYSSLAHYVTELRKEIDFPDGVRYSQFFDLSFDLAMHDIFVTFSSGGTLVPASSMDLMLPHDYVRKNKIDIWFSVPMLSVVAMRGQANKDIEHKLTTALFCGEALVTEYATRFRSFLVEDGGIYNLYGPTEATIAFTIKKYDQTDIKFPTVPLGEGFGENRIAIEAEKGVVKRLSDGLRGELLLSGPQVFDGYKPNVVSDCFVKNGDHLFYRTGDNVEVKANQLLHRGRKDCQIKFRGYRIELGDIEATARRVLNCTTTVAVLVGEGERLEIVLAYEKMTEINDFTALNNALPSYMLPGRYIRLEKVPTNINGKVDRIAIKELVERL